MKDFIKYTLAALLAIGLFMGMGFLVLVGVAAAGGGKPSVPSKAVLVYDLSMPIPDSPQEADPGAMLRKAMTGAGGGEGIPLPTLIRTLDKAAKDSKVSALFLTGHVQSQGYASGPAALKELREALQRFKASGKPILAYNQDWSKAEYYLAAGASTLYCNPFGYVDVSAPSSSPVFFAGLFKKYGIDVQVTRVGKYKSAVEPFILEKMSPENREQTTLYLGHIWEEWKDTVAKDRKTTPDALQTVADEKAALKSTEAVQAKLVDKLANYDEVLDDLKALSGKAAKDKDFPQITLQDYTKLLEAPKGKNRIAVVYAEGEIVDGEGNPDQVGGDRVARILRRARLDKDVKAIVLRVNSPGGSATASDLIQREVIASKKAGKPVIVSMGFVAASGGYWISTYADRIFAEPNTITGSIGVFGLSANVQKLANTHGLTFDEVKLAKLGNPGITRPLDEAELARRQALVDDIYDEFIRKVSEGRKLDPAKVREIAQGRVWSGKSGKDLGLVDEFGGLQDAIAFAAKQAKVEGDYRVDAPEGPKSPVERLMKMMGGGEPRRLVRQTGPAVQVLDQLEQRWRILQAMNDPRGIYARLPLELDLSH